MTSTIGLLTLIAAQDKPAGIPLTFIIFLAIVTLAFRLFTAKDQSDGFGVGDGCFFILVCIIIFLLLLYFAPDGNIF